MTPAAEPIRFIDLEAQRRRLEPDLTAALTEAVASGAYIGGPKVAELEERLSAFCGAGFSVACANGTDGLGLVLRAWGAGPGDAVFVPAFTFAATAGAVALLGAIPVFVDVSEATFNLDARSLADAVAWARAEGLRPKAVIAVDLFGQPADYPAIEAVATEAGLHILADAAQSFGASLGNRAVGTLGHATVTSFYPSKPLGCYGDGGAVLTDDEELAAEIRSLRDHGQGRHRYEHVRIGVNSRLDAIQAVVLLQKLTIFADELRLRQDVADRYRAALGGSELVVPQLSEGATSSWAQYTLRSSDRDGLAESCRRAGVPTAIHYPIPLSKQPAYRAFPSAPRGVPVAERLADTVISLPMHPYLRPEHQDAIVEAVLGAEARGGRRAAR